MKEEERESACRFQLLGDRCDGIVLYRLRKVSKSLNGCAYQTCVRQWVCIPAVLHLCYPILLLNVFSSSGSEYSTFTLCSINKCYLGQELSAFIVVTITVALYMYLDFGQHLKGINILTMTSRLSL